MIFLVAALAAEPGPALGWLHDESAHGPTTHLLAADGSVASMDRIVLHADDDLWWIEHHQQTRPAPACPQPDAAPPHLDVLRAWRITGPLVHRRAPTVTLEGDHVAVVGSAGSHIVLRIDDDGDPCDPARGATTTFRTLDLTTGAELSPPPPPELAQARSLATSRLHDPPHAAEPRLITLLPRPRTGGQVDLIAELTATPCPSCARGQILRGTPTVQVPVAPPPSSWSTALQPVPMPPWPEGAGDRYQGIGGPIAPDDELALRLSLGSPTRTDLCPELAGWAGSYGMHMLVMSSADGSASVRSELTLTLTPQRDRDGTCHLTSTVLQAQPGPIGSGRGTSLVAFDHEDAAWHVLLSASPPTLGTMFSGRQTHHGRIEGFWTTGSDRVSGRFIACPLGADCPPPR